MEKRDLEVFSRQQLVLGEHGLSKLLGASLCIVGFDGLGSELAKNCLLAGVHRLFICDNQTITNFDVSTNLCLRHKPFETSALRAKESVAFLQQFNPFAHLATFPEFTTEILQNHKPDLVVVCNKAWSSAHQIAAECRGNNIPVIIAFTGGLYYLYALDLGAYEYINVQRHKCVDIHLTDVVKVFAEDSEEFIFQATHTTAMPLDVGDVVDLLDSNGKIYGSAALTSKDGSKVTLSTTLALESEVYIIHKPKLATLNFPTLQEIKGFEPALKLAHGLKTWEIFKHDNPNALPRDTEGFANFFALCGAEEKNRDYYKRFYDSSFAATVPLNSIAGGLITDQAVKILSRCFTPTTEWKGNNFFNFLYQDGLTTEDCQPGMTNFEQLYCSQITNFGKSFQNTLAEKSVMVIGAGALGNEFVKGAAMVGISTAEQASFVVVDNDSVMTSNISRQLCFVEADTLKPKAPTLCSKVKANFNNDMKLNPVIVKLDHTTEAQIGHTKFSTIDLFVSALDNVAARNTLERISQMYHKPMIDGGTNGMNGTQHNFLLGQTAESYSPTVAIDTAVSCSPKPVVASRSDVVHNAKIHFEKLLDKIMHEDLRTSSALEFIQFEINKAASASGPLEIPITNEQQKKMTKYIRDAVALKHAGNLSTHFDKDQTEHINLLHLLCDIVSQTFRVPPPSVMEIRQKAGDIIPSIISSTATVSGFMLLNSLQVANASPKFVNAASNLAGVTLSLPRTSTRRHIFSFGKLRDSTTFSEIAAAVPSKVGEIHQCILYGDFVVTIPGRGLEALGQKCFMKYVMNKLSLPDRKHFVVEIQFQKLDEESMELTQETKFLIVTLPKLMRQHYKQELNRKLDFAEVEKTLRDAAVVQQTLLTQQIKHIEGLQEKISALERGSSTLERKIQTLTIEKQQLSDRLQRMNTETNTLRATLTRERNSALQTLDRVNNETNALRDTMEQERLSSLQALAQRNANIAHLKDSKEAIAAKAHTIKNQLKIAIDTSTQDKLAIERTHQSQVTHLVAEYTKLHSQFIEMNNYTEAMCAMVHKAAATETNYIAEIQALQTHIQELSRSWWTTHNPLAKFSCFALRKSDVMRTAIAIASVQDVSPPHFEAPQLPADLLGSIYVPEKPLAAVQTPLSLPNLGNTCFLAAATQLLYVAYVNNPAYTKDAASFVGQSLTKLFVSRNPRYWQDFVTDFFKLPDFQLGRQDDSGKAFAAIALVGWPAPNPSHQHVIARTNYIEPHDQCKDIEQIKYLKDNFIIYVGSSSADADMGKSYERLFSRTHNCKHGCGKVNVRTDFEHWPATLFVKTSSRASLLLAAKKGIYFSRSVSGKEVERVRYELLGIAVHSGSTTASGHYTSLVLLGEQWWYCSDDYSQVQPNIDQVYLNDNDIIHLLVFKQC